MTAFPVLMPIAARIGNPTANEGVGGSLASLLFGGGENGFLFGDFTELDELFTTFNGTTNVASDSDPVGSAFDDHSWGASTYAQVIAAQSEVWPQPTFDASTGLSLGAGWTISGGKANFAAGTASAMQMSSGTVVAGQLYRVQYTVSSYGGSGTVNANVGNTENLYRAANGTYVEYIRAGSTGRPLIYGSVTFSGSIDDVSFKVVPGNHGLQATSGFRPQWKANSGKPYLLPDGADDNLLTSFNPTQSMAMFFAANFAASPGATRLAMGAFTVGRCWFGYNTTGQAVVGWGTENTAYTFDDLRGTTKVIVITGDASTRAIWYDGVLVDERAVSGNPAGTNPIMVGANNLAGTPSSFFSTGIFAAGAVNRRVTPAEIARITSDFQRTYQ